MPQITTTTVEALISDYATDIAFAAEEEPAATLTDFIEQLRTASHNLAFYAGINGAEDLETAAAYLADADETTDDTERSVFLNQAAENLKYTADIVDEYRLMV